MAIIFIYLFKSTFIKKECIYRNNFKSEAEFKKELDSYIDFYNNQREQHYLRYHSPVQFELQIA